MTSAAQKLFPPGTLTTGMTFSTASSSARDGAGPLIGTNPRELFARLAYYAKLRYLTASFRHPELFPELLRTRDLESLLRRWDELEFATPAMRAMARASVAKTESEFLLAGRHHRYCYDNHNHAWGTERTVEVPVCLSLLAGVEPSSALEIGNVLSHYAACSHRVVDKYEVAERVVNQDVVDYSPERTFDLILSVSTIEHVGWDEVRRDRTKIPRAILRLRSWLSPKGEAWITVPLGYNRWLDRLLQSGDLGVDRALYMRRASFDNRWEECDLRAASRMPYGGPIDRVVARPPFPRANAVGFLMFRRA